MKEDWQTQREASIAMGEARGKGADVVVDYTEEKKEEGEEEEKRYK